MQNLQILKMIDEGRLEELKAMIQEEIYVESLKKSKPGATKRHSAMKKYFGYTNSSREMLTKPCIVEYEGDEYMSFCNSYSLALTSEECGSMTLFEDVTSYPNVGRLIRYDSKPVILEHIHEVLAEAKSKGYRLKKSEVDGYKYKYLIKYDGAYFKLGLFDATYSIIDDGGPVEVYHKKGDATAPIVIKTSIGVCLVLPIKVIAEELDSSIVVIDM